MSMAIPEIDRDKCAGSGNCVKHCPTNAIELVSGKAVIVRPEDCDYCTDCEFVCPSGAIKCPFEIVLVKTDTLP